MSDTKFTPGPWRISPWYDAKAKTHDKRWQGIYRPVPGQKYGSISGVVTVGLKGDADDYWLCISPEDAALIAAAPDMYEALRLCVIDWISETHGFDVAMKWAETGEVTFTSAPGRIADALHALAKARGVQEMTDGE